MTPINPQLFTEEEKATIVARSKEIFIASIELTYRALEKGSAGVDEAHKLAQISQVFGITLLGVPGPSGRE